MSSPVPAVNGSPVEAEPKSEVGSETETDPAAENTTASESSPAAGMGPPASTEKKWPGWPGDCVFRLIVPVLKVGSIIGRKGDIIKKMCEETRARIRVLHGPVGNPDRIDST